MCGGGTDGYQNEQIFRNKNTVLQRQEFVYPQYEQVRTSEFISGLSIIDALMNIGWNSVRELLIAN